MNEDVSHVSFEMNPSVYSKLKCIADGITEIKRVKELINDIIKSIVTSDIREYFGYQNNGCVLYSQFVRIFYPDYFEAYDFTASKYDLLLRMRTIAALSSINPAYVVLRLDEVSPNIDLEEVHEHIASVSDSLETLYQMLLSRHVCF